MSASQNKSLARRYFDEIWNRKDANAIDDLVAEDVAGHVNDVDLQGRDILRKRLQAHTTIYSDSRFAIADVIAEEDKVLVRWNFSGRFTGEFMGRSGSGEQVTASGMNLFRIAGGRIAELWVNADDLGELQQLGVLPALGPVEA